MDMGLGGRVVVVTGATANIGRAIALSFAREGARVVVVGRDEVQGKIVVETARELGAPDALWVGCDVTDPNAVADLARAVLDRFGAIDVLVNNVGGNVDVGPFVESEPGQWKADIDLTLMSTLHCTRAFLPAMIEHGWGRVINIGSMSGIIGDPYLAVYSAAKAAVHGFTRVLAIEVGKSNITVNAIAPYGTRPADPEEAASSGSRSHPLTGVFRTLPPDKAKQLSSIFRQGVLPAGYATSDQVASAAVYLASEQAGFITGEVLMVDGGVRLA